MAHITQPSTPTTTRTQHTNSNSDSHYSDLFCTNPTFFLHSARQWPLTPPRQQTFLALIRVCMCVCKCVHVCACVCACAGMHIYIYTYIYEYIYIYIYVHIHIHKTMFVCICVTAHSVTHCCTLKRTAPQYDALQHTVTEIVTRCNQDFSNASK